MSNKYSAEFKEQAVKRVLAGESAVKAAIHFPCHAGWDGVFAMRNNRSLIHLTTVPSLPPDTLSGWLPCTCI